ncbi:MAG: ABC transporter substrate-binding protein [Defluviitaleaceae bacterium]|nr:ABC transporter substrate-binding protein [Defluviitaleaceae bacterium]
MNKFKKFAVIAGVMTIGFVMAACGGNEEVTPTGQAPEITAPVVTTPEPASVEVNEAEEPTFATITDFRGNVTNVRQNPTSVAIFDFGILDMLYSIGFENTGIETLIVPTMNTLPDALYAFRDGIDGVNILTGGTLFYVDRDILDFVNPELVILGARSFGMNQAGDRLSTEDRDAFQNETIEQYSDTNFIWLTINTTQANLLGDMRANAEVLSQIFPGIEPLLSAEIAAIESEMAAIREVTENLDMNAAFVMMVDATRMSIFLEGSRFGFLFDEFGFNSIELDLEAWSDQHGFDMQSEFLLEHNPDIIFLLDRSEPETGLGAATDNFMNDSIIQRSNAFINGHIYSGLPMAEWYTVVGGFQSARRMIEDVNRFIYDINAN